MGKTKKYGLSPGVSPEHTVVAIASHERIYLLAWKLNQHLHMDLSASGEYRMKRKGKELAFPLFRWYDETRMLSYHLLANRTPEAVLVPALRNIDFFLHITPAPPHDQMETILHTLRNMQEVITSFLPPLDEHPPLRNMILE